MNAHINRYQTIIGHLNSEHVKVCYSDVFTIHMFAIQIPTVFLVRKNCEKFRICIQINFCNPLKLFINKSWFQDVGIINKLIQIDWTEPGQLWRGQRVEEVVGRDEPDPPRSSRPKDATIREQSNLCPERKINNEIHQIQN